MSNELTYILLDVIDEMSPILEQNPMYACIAITEKLLDRVVEMIAPARVRLSCSTLMNDRWLA